MFINVGEDSPRHDDRASKSDCERLYEAYNQLHNMAQLFSKPFDAPAILVVGHQTDGKSALVEALMGFQFNSVGGGTKTRCPVTIHMKYNASCASPSCYLHAGDREEELSLQDLQDYIEKQNQRLESQNQFSDKEVVVKIEYKYCPNLTIIDTPGLVSAAPGEKHSAMQHAARQVERIVLDKMTRPEYIILCLEDNSDWNNATTRRLVMKVDPSLSRSVVVSTKFDTRIPQFARPQDADMFLKPRCLESTMLGGSPFFTSVPSGRVGTTKDCAFATHEQFREKVYAREHMDIQELESRLLRKLSQSEREHLGVTALRSFLETLLHTRYLENVPTILPLLERELRTTAQRLDATNRQLSDLQIDQLKIRGREFVEAFLTKLQLVLRGTIAAPVTKFGETLFEERNLGGAFLGPSGQVLPLPSSLANADMRLYGGAQFHRALAEFRACVGALPCPAISREEVVNACGAEELHDGVNYMRTACVIAVAKAREMLEPLIHQLGYRLSHVLRRMLEVALYMLTSEKDSGATMTLSTLIGGPLQGGAMGGAAAGQPCMLLAAHQQFMARVTGTYHSFIQDVERGCKARCLEDLYTTTRYVTWSLHSKNYQGIRAMLSRPLPLAPIPRQQQQQQPPPAEALQQDPESPTASVRSRSPGSGTMRNISSHALQVTASIDLRGSTLALSELLADGAAWQSQAAPGANRYEQQPSTPTSVPPPALSATPILPHASKASTAADASMHPSLSLRPGTAHDVAAAESCLGGLHSSVAGPSLGAVSAIDALEHTLWSRQLTRVSEELVAALVAQIFEGIRDQLVQAAELKFNCFFLLPLVDIFPTHMRSELERAYQEESGVLLDVAGLRASLQEQLRGNEAELLQLERLQSKFSVVHATLAGQQGQPPAARPPVSQTAVTSSQPLPLPCSPSKGSSAQPPQYLNMHPALDPREESALPVSMGAALAPAAAAVKNPAAAPPDLPAGLPQGAGQAGGGAAGAGLVALKAKLAPPSGDAQDVRRASGGVAALAARTAANGGAASEPLVHGSTPSRLPNLQMQGPLQAARGMV